MQHYMCWLELACGCSLLEIDALNLRRTRPLSLSAKTERAEFIRAQVRAHHYGLSEKTGEFVLCHDFADNFHLLGIISLNIFYSGI
jgi:hypothetical protein